MAAASQQQPQEPLPHIAIHRLELSRCVARSEVIAPAAKHRIEFPDHVADVFKARPAATTGQVMDLVSNGLHCSPRRPPEQIVASLEMRSHDPQMTAEEVEAFLIGAGPADLLPSVKPYDSTRAFDAPLRRQGLPRRPGPATRRFGAYRDGTSTRKLDTARIAARGDSIRTYHCNYCKTTGSSGSTTPRGS